MNGQTRSGRSGSHGETGAPNILGFSNKARLAEIRAQLTELCQRLTALTQQVSALSEQATELRRGKEAHQYVLDADWAAIDVDAVDAATAATQADKERILSADSRLSELQRRHQQLSGELDAAQGDKHLARAEPPNPRRRTRKACRPPRRRQPEPGPDRGHPGGHADRRRHSATR